uniref:Major facilitator superfamily (MFS) profile domain-containing protein n=1 Tax=Acrobeloides nanus TaxID=290746 RepID=A0A914EF84_9BILA
MLVTGPLASGICNRIGCRNATIIGAIIASIGCAISYYATTVKFLTFPVGIFMGIGFGLMYCSAIVIVTMYFERLRTLATGVTVCGDRVGTFVFFENYLISLITHYDWPIVFIIYAVIVLLCVPCGMLYRPIEFEPIYDGEDEEMIEIKKNGKVDHHRSLELHRPEPIAEEDEDKASPHGTDDRKELLSPPVITTKPTLNGHGKLRAAISHNEVNEDPEKASGEGTTGLQRYSSLGLVAKPRSSTFSESAGYLNVKDVFYTGSLSGLPEYNKEGEKFRSISSLHSHGAISAKDKTHGKEMSLDNQPIAEEDENLDSQATSASRAIEIWRTVTKMMDLSLFTDPIYVLFAVSNFLTSIGFNAPPMFMPMNAEKVLGLSKPVAAQTVAAYGIANIMGRIVFGLVCDRAFPFKYGKDRARNRLWIYNWSLMIIGVGSLFVYLMLDRWVFTSYCFIFGFFISSYVCLTSVILVDLIGVDRLTNAFGLLLLVQGIATFVGPPFCGWLFDITKKYDWTFVFCGVCLFLSGIMLFVIPFMKKFRNEVRLENSAEKNAPYHVLT